MVGTVAASRLILIRAGAIRNGVLVLLGPELGILAAAGSRQLEGLTVVIDLRDHPIKTPSRGSTRRSRLCAG